MVFGKRRLLSLRSLLVRLGNLMRTSVNYPPSPSIPSAFKGLVQALFIHLQVHNEKKNLSVAEGQLFQRVGQKPQKNLPLARFARSRWDIPCSCSQCSAPCSPFFPPFFLFFPFFLSFPPFFLFLLHQGYQKGYWFAMSPLGGSGTPQSPHLELPLKSKLSY